MSAKENRGWRIVIAEDSPTQAEQLRYVLETNDYQVSVANNGKEALKLVQTEKPDTVITDIIMPEMDGYELCRQIKEDSSLKSIPVVLLTALSDTADVIKGLECGADNFITKPYSEKVLLSRIEYLRLNRQMHESESLQTGVKVMFSGQKYAITSDKLQILNLLISTYESAVNKNRELEQVQGELRRLNEELEQRVAARTAELAKANERLTLEVIERKRSEEHVRNLNEVLKALRGINQLITMEKDPERLIQKSCSLMTQKRGFLCAWILLFDRDRNYIIATISGGKEVQSFYDQLKQNDYPACIERILAQEDTLSICSDISSGEVGCLPRQVLSEGRGLISRLEYEGNVYGVLSVYVPSYYSIDPEEQSLFRELAGDIAFALYNIEKEVEHRQAEEALRQSEENYKELAESISDIFFALDNKLRFTYWNKASEKVTGITARKAIGMRLDEIFPKTEDKHKAKAAYKNVIKTGKPQRFVQEYRLQDEDYIFEIKVYPSQNGVSVFAEDITQQKKMEQQLVVADKLASIGQLASGIAHEVNNPLTGVIGFASLLLERDIPDDVRGDLEIISKEAKRAANVVKGLLTFARKQETEKTPVDLNTIIQEVLQLRAYEQKVSNIEIITGFAPDLPQIIGNRDQLQQVLMNLIINAEQAMLTAHKRGTLIINTEHVRDIVRVSVIDDGPGISPENMKKLFIPFFTTKERGKGTGLGLSICHGIITEHNGSIYAESEQGKGTSFILELPVPPEEDEQI